MDGGPTRNRYLMQFQSDLLNTPVSCPEAEELSGIGAAYMTGLSCGLYPEFVLHHLHYQTYHPCMDSEARDKKLAVWGDAIHKTITP